MLRNVALLGKARAGKNTVGDYLTEHYGYRQVAFAGPLKAMALEADPVLSEYKHTDGWHQHRLSERVSEWGWERTKDMFPESRRFLQNLGSAVRSIDPGFWLREGLDTAAEYNMCGGPVVFTDVRYLNEATALRHAGYTMVRVVRPAADLGAYTAHPSEIELDDYAVDYTVVNDGSVRELCGKVSRLMR